VQLHPLNDVTETPNEASREAGDKTSDPDDGGGAEALKDEISHAVALPAANPAMRTTNNASPTRT
jgi:hypothetical protein